MAAKKTAIPFPQYRRALVYVAPYWRGLLLVLVLGLFSTAVGLAQPYISRLLIDDALLRHNAHALLQIAVLMVLVSVAGFILNTVSGYRYVTLSAECLFDMRLAVYRRLQRLSPRYYANTKMGDIVSRINNDIGEVQRVCSDTLLSILSNILFLVGSIAIMASLNWRLFLTSVALLPVGVAALRHYQARLTAKKPCLVCGWWSHPAMKNAKRKHSGNTIQDLCRRYCPCNCCHFWRAPFRALL